MNVDNINMIIRSIFINTISLLIFLKINNCKNVKKHQKVEIGISVIALVIIEIYLRKMSDIIITISIVCLIQIVLLKFITRLKTYNILISVIISIAVSYLLFIVSGTLEFIIQMSFKINNKIINCILIFVIQFILIYFIFRIKRIKNGLSFLKKENGYIEIAIINISAILIFVYLLIGYNYDPIMEHIFFYYIVLGAFMILIVEKTIVMYYKQKLIDDTINQYKQDLQEKDNQIKRLTDEAFKVSKINHEFYNRQKALELMVKEKQQNFNMETGEDFDILNRIQNLTSEHAEKVKEIKSLPALQLTNIPEIDDMFTYMQKECSKSGIQFKLNINGNIHSLINNFIPKDKLETLIGDHIRDAIIAINSGDNQNKEIFVILGIRDNCYELCIYDTGIEFEIKTLLNLGRVPITTHKGTGGSGIGFMTTFETLNECNASLIIEERHPVNDKDYTKAVKVRFDKKNEYRIYSYRAREIDKMNNNRRLVCKEYQ